MIAQSISAISESYLVGKSYLRHMHMLLDNKKIQYMKTQCVRGQFWIDFENFGLWLQRLEMPWIRSLPSGFVDAELSTIGQGASPGSSRVHRCMLHLPALYIREFMTDIMSLAGWKDLKGPRLIKICQNSEASCGPSCWIIVCRSVGILPNSQVIPISH